MIAKIICERKYPFIQAIFDVEIQPYEDCQMIFMGDAATTLPPHSASGVMKALSQAITLYEYLMNAHDKNVWMLLSQWKIFQQKNNAEEIEKEKTMGKALVTETPSWVDMNQETLDVWWSKVMKKTQGWYATPLKTSKHIFSTNISADVQDRRVFVQSKL